MNTDHFDYFKSGMDIQHAMLDLAKRFPDAGTRPALLWAGLSIQTSDKIRVPVRGRVSAEILSAINEDQGFDLALRGGWFQLPGGEHVSVLRTWNDARFAATIDYPYWSPTCELRTWNVFRMRYKGGQVLEEKWTGNAGFWIDVEQANTRTYHCSHGSAQPPDFGGLVFRVTTDAATLPGGV